MIAARKQRIITFLSDFGPRDWFVAAVKGEILKINPMARGIDITHSIGPCAVRQAAFILSNVAASFPAQTVHLAIVDPEVGSARQPLIVRAQGQYFVGPDNGIFSYVTGKTPLVYAIKERGRVSRTFHGRDIFAPVAAKLSLGEKPSALGAVFKNFLRFTLPPITRKRRLIRGEIIYADRFGNLITNMPNTLMIRRFDIKGIHSLPVGSCYSQALPGRLLAVRGSTGYYEIASYTGDAARKTGARVGTKVVGYL